MNKFFLTLTTLIVVLLTTNASAQTNPYIASLTGDNLQIGIEVEMGTHIPPVGQTICLFYRHLGDGQIKTWVPFYSWLLCRLAPSQVHFWDSAQVVLAQFNQSQAYAQSGVGIVLPTHTVYLDSIKIYKTGTIPTNGGVALPGHFNGAFNKAGPAPTLFQWGANNMYCTYVLGQEVSEVHNLNPDGTITVDNYGELKAGPSPAKSGENIFIHSAPEDVEWTICDQLGRVVKNGSGTTIPTLGLARGNYILTATSQSPLWWGQKKITIQP